MLIEQSIKLSPLDRFVYWIKERHAILERRVAGLQKPWTDDTILQSYRFCNVRREDDTVTQWIRVNWREPHADDPNLWFALVLARLINWPETLAEIGYPVGAKVWQKQWFLNVMKSRQREGKKIFTGAYMIHADAKHGGTKAEYLAEAVLSPMWEHREWLCNMRHTTLVEAFMALRQYRDMGEFMAGQVIADLKYVPPMTLAHDWWTWATPGPGSRRGLNRLCNRALNAKWTPGSEWDWHEELRERINLVAPQIVSSVGRLHAQDYQNCLCEYDKYCRVLHGEGRPRSKYPGAK